MAIFRGSGGSIDGQTESLNVPVAISQGGTGSATAAGARTNLGLGTAATTSSDNYATAAQGALADTAVQPADLGTVATSNSYDDLDDLPTLGTAAATDAVAYATAAQGTLADSAVQPGDLATVATTGDYDDLSNKPTIPTDLDSLTDVVITAVANNEILKYNGTNWVNAAAGSGTVTSVAATVPTGFTVSGSPITTSGTLAVTFSAGYALPTTAKQTEWDTAYGWGNHASAGYLTSSTAASTYQPLDGDLTAIAALSGTSGLVKKTAANTYTLDTSTYLTSYTETDPVFVASEAYSITSTDTSHWDTAYGWGNHASAGYAADNAVVKLTGDQTIGGTKTFSSTITGSISGNAGTATNGVVTTGSYADPSWITSLSGTKLTGTVVATNGVVTTGSYADPAWITSLAGSKISGSIDGGTY